MDRTGRKLLKMAVEFDKACAAKQKAGKIKGYDIKVSFGNFLSIEDLSYEFSYVQEHRIYFDAYPKRRGFNKEFEEFMNTLKAL